MYFGTLLGRGGYPAGPGLIFRWILGGILVALGHPLGATGAMLVGTALDELERTGKSTALTTLCIASGMGASTIIEKV